MIKILKNKEELELGFALRIEVFVKEQNVPIELELDDKDYSDNTVHIGYFHAIILLESHVLSILDKDVIQHRTRCY